jgi:hypothetical protein
MIGFFPFLFFFDSAERFCLTAAFFSDEDISPVVSGVSELTRTEGRHLGYPFLEDFLRPQGGCFPDFVFREISTHFSLNQRRKSSEIASMAFYIYGINNVAEALCPFGLQVGGDPSALAVGRSFRDLPTFYQTVIPL